jgi:hypothetical protein
MSLEFNDKGKYFTDIISKVAIPAIIQTVSQRIEGSVHVRPDQRVKDELDRAELFLAVTDAKVLNADGTIACETEFMLVLRSQIIWVIPSVSNPNDGDQ